MSEQKPAIGSRYRRGRGLALTLTEASYVDGHQRGHGHRQLRLPIRLAATTLPSANATARRWLRDMGQADATVSVTGWGRRRRLTLTAGNWNIPQTVTVTAIDDSVAEGAHISTITHNVVSTDPNYNGYYVRNVLANVTDNDTSGVTIAESRRFYRRQRTGADLGYLFRGFEYPTGGQCDGDGFAGQPGRRGGGGEHAGDFEFYPRQLECSSNGDRNRDR